MESSVSMTVRFIQFDNPEGKDDNGQCCDEADSVCELNGGCDHYFKMCVDNPQR